MTTSWMSTPTIPVIPPVPTMMVQADGSYNVILRSLKSWKRLIPNPSLGQGGGFGGYLYVNLSLGRKDTSGHLFVNSSLGADVNGRPRFQSAWCGR